MLSAKNCTILSHVCLVSGFVSIGASIAIWFLMKEPDAAYGERFGIFVGLWAPTFISLANRLSHFAEAKSK
ncbi:MAG: hypothetical protein NTV55_07305 [Planctomycetota bacterium]|nr:hypothetical protein [Planctomycetota bacterium]RLS39332.1 MAG: hypothetical protein DWH82_05970 [Planctomycetota bacterium]